MHEGKEWVLVTLVSGFRQLKIIRMRELGGKSCERFVPAELTKWQSQGISQGSCNRNRNCISNLTIPERSTKKHKCSHNSCRRWWEIGNNMLQQLCFSKTKKIVRQYFTSNLNLKYKQVKFQTMFKICNLILHSSWRSYGPQLSIFFYKSIEYIKSAKGRNLWYTGSIQGGLGGER